MSEVTGAVAESPSEVQATPSSRLLNFQYIAAKRDITIRRVEVPEWDGHVFVRSLNALGKEKFMSTIRHIEGEGKDAKVVVNMVGAEPRLVAMTLCDEDGNFSVAQDEDSIAEAEKIFGTKDWRPISRISDVSAEINGLGNAAVEAAKND